MAEKRTPEERNIIKLKNLAKEVGIDENPLFVTTLDQYKFQLSVINKMKEQLNSSDDLLTTKEYVKGRCNEYASPILKELPKHCDSATKTAALLVNMIKDAFASADKSNDRFSDFLRWRHEIS